MLSPTTTIYASGMVCRTPEHSLFIIMENGRLEDFRWHYNTYKAAILTAVLARTLIFWRGMKPVRSARETTPIGQTECGS